MEEDDDVVDLTRKGWVPARDPQDGKVELEVSS